MNNDQVSVMFANEEHTKYADLIVRLIYESALQRGTGIARRSPEYIIEKIRGGKAVVALYGDRLIGFSYIESWSHGDYVATLRPVSRTRLSSWPDDDSRLQKYSRLPRRCR